ncbi:uncharacterized protein LOC132757309 [Ruditapes philippinarum]|uniref:uncharacterized protein LOC132757309 n=1 Tax=Ruditapes philippinarum TaxID=129788 RepID=UPI00295B7DAE|nr:uncharacterized protein LOC132757309 [Ruditapes philippinarum]
MAELGYRYSNSKLKQLAGAMAYEMKATPRKLERSRAKSSTPEKVTGYFKKLEEVLKQHNLLEKPQHIYNLDENGLQTDHRPYNVVANSNSKCQAITSPRSSTTTLIGCVNALRQLLPPFFVFKGKRFNPDLMKGSSVGAKGVMSDSGWSNAAIFQQYLEEHFLPNARPCPEDKQPIILIYDEHSSHKSPKLINWARERGLILFVLPARISHLLQPLDVAVFGSSKNNYYSECSSFMSRCIGQIITRYELCSIACKAYTRAMSPSNIQSAFRKTGIVPIDPTVVSLEK